MKINWKKLEPIIAAAFGVALVVVIVYQVFIAKPKPPPKNPNSATKTTAAAAKKGTATKPSAKSAKDAKGAAATPEADDAEVGIDFDSLLEELLTQIEVVNFDYSAAKIARDPMRPLVGQLSGPNGKAVKGGKGGPGGLNALDLPGFSQTRFMKEVSAIVYNDTNPVAVVDGEVVYVGYRYPDGVTVQSIGRDNVVFKQGDVEIPVELKEH